MPQGETSSQVVENKLAWHALCITRIQLCTWWERGIRHGTYHCKENVNVCVTYACGKHKRDVYEENIIWFGSLQPRQAKRQYVLHPHFMHGRYGRVSALDVLVLHPISVHGEVFLTWWTGLVQELLVAVYRI